MPEKSSPKGKNFKDPLVLFCLAGVLILSLASFFAPWISGHSPYTVYGESLTVPPLWMKGGSAQFLLGTDDLGRDFLTRLLYGGKISLLVGGVVMMLSLIFGLVFGVPAALSKRWGPWIMGVVDIFMSFPGILIAIVVVAVLGPGLFNACLAAGLMCLPLMIRLVRSLVLREMGRAYVESSRSFGAAPPRLVFFHILPNCLGEISVQSVLNFSEGILTVAALSFLGLGARPPLPEWGGDDLRRPGLYTKLLVAYLLSGAVSFDAGFMCEHYRGKTEGFSRSRSVLRFRLRRMRFLRIGLKFRALYT